MSQFQLTPAERAKIMLSYEERSVISTIEEIVNSRWPKHPAPELTQDAVDWEIYRQWHRSNWGMAPPDNHRTSLQFIAFRAGRVWGKPTTNQYHENQT
jgi:hypothetical protein